MQDSSEVPGSWGQSQASRLPETRRLNDPSDSPPGRRLQSATDLPGSRSRGTAQPLPSFDSPEPWRQDYPPSQSAKFPDMERTPATSSAQPPSGASADKEMKIVLELSGDGVLPVPLEQRRIGPVSLAEPVLVGRRHQPELHRQAIMKECLQFLSRDHFRIDRLGHGGFQITAMTNNPIWLAGRLMDEPYELSKDESVPIDFGDRVALGTGNNSTTAGEALQRLSWLFKQASASAEPEVAKEGGGFLSAGIASFKNAIARATGATGGSDNQGSHSPRLEPASPGPGSRVARDSPWDSTGGGGTPGNQWEPMLPPAASVFTGGSRPRNDRPSEIFGPEPRLHSAQERRSPASSGVMRPPVNFGGTPEESSPSYHRGGYGQSYDNGAIDMTGREEHDAFAKSGFSYH